MFYHLDGVIENELNSREQWVLCWADVSAEYPLVLEPGTVTQTNQKYFAAEFSMYSWIWNFLFHSKNV